MARRKKHPKLPNGYGQIKYLGKGRRNPYGVYPPATEYAESGNMVTPTALCYVDDWYKGFMVLTAYKAGTYTQGYELTLNTLGNKSTLDQLTKQLLQDYGQAMRRPVMSKTFAELYEDFKNDKYYDGHPYSKDTVNCTRNAFKNSKPLHDRTFTELRHADLQSALDNCGKKHASQEHIVSLFHQMYAYAIRQEIVTTDHSQFVTIKVADDEEPGVPFTDEELLLLWKNQQDPNIEMLLIMCYSGFRISAYQNIVVDLDNMSLTGGVKTKYSKNRTVPIHSAIQPLIKRRIQRDGKILAVRTPVFRTDSYAALQAIGVEKHTPHDCRHTFSRLAEKYEVKENDRKRMMGHAFKDITNKVYGHRELEDLRKEIEKIKAPTLP